MDARIVRETKEGTVLTVHVQPKASRTACAGLHGEALKIRVAAPPVEGAANEAVLRYLARIVDVPFSNLRIESGAGARLKRILIRDTTAQTVLARLEAATQKGA